MTDHEKVRDDVLSQMTEAQLGPVGAGLPPIPEPEKLDSSYGLDEAVALAIVPNRALIFWELASEIRAGIEDGEEFVLIRMALQGEIPTRETHWPVKPIGRFQDSGVQPGHEYLYVIARLQDDEEVPLLVTNPVRMPLLRAPEEIPGELASSVNLAHLPLRKKLKEAD